MPGRSRSPTLGDLGVAREQAVHERPVRVARARMHDEPGGLGHDDDVGVLVAHVDGYVLGAGRHARPAGRRAPRRPRRPAAFRLFPTGVAAHDHVTGLDQRLHLGPAPPGQHRHDAVDPLPRERVGNDDRLDPVIPLLGAPGRASRRVGSLTSRSVVAGTAPAITSSTAPIVIAESATLNVGKLPTRTKSTTAPCRNPGERITRSRRLPVAPPRTSDERDQGHPVVGAPDGADEHDRDHDRKDGEQRRESLEQAERAAGVAAQPELDARAEDRRPAPRRAGGPPTSW